MKSLLVIFNAVFFFVFFGNCLADEAVATAIGLERDSETARQWGLTSIGAQKAYDAGFTGAGVRVGVFDSGIDINHSEFAGRPFAGSADIDLSFVAGRVIPLAGDKQLHGTGVAGVIVANRNGIGMHGVAYDAILAVTGVDLDESMFDAQMAFGFAYLSSVGAEFRNASLSIRENVLPSTVGKNYVEAFLPLTLFTLRQETQGSTITIWAAGNWSGKHANFPALLPYYFSELESTNLAVVALNRSGGLASYSNMCGIAAGWCLAAPGGDVDAGILTPYAGDAKAYAMQAGTSFAAPHVTGALAVARQIFPDADVRDLRKLILKTAADLGQPGVDAVFGWGKLDLGNVVDTIAPAGRSVFASSAWSRHLAMQQVAHMPFSGSLQRGSSHRQFWMNGGVMRGGIDAASGLPGVQARGQALTLGVDVIERSDLVAGLGFGFTRTRTDESGLSNSASAKGYHGLGYLRWDDEHWYVKSAAGISYFRQDHVRRDISGLAGTTYSLSNPVARSKQSALGLFADMEAGRKVDFRGLDTAVFARLSSTYQRFGAARESGVDILGYELEAGSVSTLGIGPGIRFSKRFDLGNWQVVPELELSYTRLLGSNDFSSGTALLGRKMEARTTPLGRDVFGIGAKLDFILPGSGVTASLGYAGSFRKSAEQQKVQLGLSIKF